MNSMVIPIRNNKQGHVSNRLWIMVFISLNELLPTAEKYGEDHVAMYSVVSDMLVMASNLVFLPDDTALF